MNSALTALGAFGALGTATSNRGFDAALRVSGSSGLFIGLAEGPGLVLGPGLLLEATVAKAEFVSNGAISIRRTAGFAWFTTRGNGRHGKEARHGEDEVVLVEDLHDAYGKMTMAITMTMTMLVCSC